MTAATPEPTLDGGTGSRGIELGTAQAAFAEWHEQWQLNGGSLHRATRNDLEEAFLKGARWAESSTGTEPTADECTPAAGGYFAEIAFFGRIEHTGYVTEVVLHGGQAAYHIDLPEKLWGGNPLAWREYAASAFFEKNPVTEESVRKAWEAERERVRRWELQQAEWERQRSQPALEAGGGGDDDLEPDYAGGPF